MKRTRRVSFEREGTTKPPLTNTFFSKSNSRTSTASPPPTESRIRQSRFSGGSQLALPKAHGLPSAFESAFLSDAHTETEIDRTLEAADEATEGVV